MRQFGYFSDEIVEISLPFVGNLIINNADAFFRDRGNEATWESFDHVEAHPVELIKSPVDIYFSIFVFSFDVIYNMFGKGPS